MATLLKSGINWTMALLFMLQLAVNPIIAYGIPSADTTVAASEETSSDAGGSQSSPNWD